MENLKRFIIYWLPPFIYMAVIFFVSSLSNITSVPDINGIDKVMHFFEYAILAFFITRALKKGTEYLKKEKIILIITLGFCFIFAASDEFHQYFVAGRSSSFYDFIADVLGVFLGAGIYYFWLYIKKIRHIESHSNS